MNKLVMFPHKGSGNHGCEAIVRSTDLLMKNNEKALFSNSPEIDKKYMRDSRIKIYKDNVEISRFSTTYFKAIFRREVLKEKDAFEKLTFENLLHHCNAGNVLLSIGGDLYCYDTPEYIYRVNSYVREQGCKTVLWGCSVEPSYIDDRMAADLSGYDLICARESITYEALKKINPHTIQTVDPAFVLPMEEVKLPADRYIGINLSPLIQKNETIKGITLENYKRLISYILDNTEEAIALIPHVVWESNDDRVALQTLKDYFNDNDRVIMVEDHNAVQQKYIIAHCKMFIGARTHATIAAYSSCVPTLVVGYSVKAKGIAKDLFGREEDYVLPVQSLKSPDDLTRAFCWLQVNENQIREHLKAIMTEYKGRTQLAVKAVEELMS